MNKFHRPDGTQGETASAPSTLVAYSERDPLPVCARAGLEGRFCACMKES